MFNLMNLQLHLKFIYKLIIFVSISKIFCSKRKYNPNILKRITKSNPEQFKKKRKAFNLTKEITKVIISEKEEFEVFKIFPIYKILDRIFLLFINIDSIFYYLNEMDYEDKFLDKILKDILKKDQSEEKRGFGIHKLYKHFLKFQVCNDKTFYDEFIEIFYKLIDFLGSMKFVNYYDEESEKPYLYDLFLLKYACNHVRMENLFKSIKYAGKNDFIKFELSAGTLSVKPSDYFYEFMKKMNEEVSADINFSIKNSPQYIIIDSHCYFDFFIKHFSKEELLGDWIYLQRNPFKITAFIKKTKEMEIFFVKNGKITFIDDKKSKTISLRMFVRLKLHLIEKNELIVVLGII